MNKVISYLGFLLRSTNEHGVHSPFVFDYLTKCLYTKPKVSKNKTHNLVIKSIPYFNFKNVVILENKELQKAIGARFLKLSDKANKTDLIYYPSPKMINAKTEMPVHNQSMVVVENIRASKSNYLKWKKFITTEDIRVSIDFFECGVVFFRKEQIKEHFVIRI